MRAFGSIRGLFSQTHSRLGSRGITVALFILLIICLFIIPLPPSVLDVLLVVNLVMALTLLLRALFISEPLQLFAFPTILLVTTLYRLALNVSSTRLILLGGDQGLDSAGRVIESFGTFVVQGDFVVGAIIFGVIATVNFVVIAKGSARVAEVSARFSLDSLPGRQLAIDADFRSENISKEEARYQRDELNRESQFYGAMDGAMRFVQGDAIAGLIITAINAIGGVSVGMQRGLSFEDAINTFGILTIGDGLVSILPSLLISVCAGIVVTHVSGRGKSTSGNEILSQVVGEPQAVMIASCALIALSLVPGFPFFPFFLVGLALLIWAARMNSVDEAAHKRSSAPSSAKLGWSADDSLSSSQQPLGLPDGDGNVLVDAYAMTSLLLEVDDKVLAPYMSEFGDGLKGFYGFVDELRDQLYRERGILVPEVSIRLVADLSAGSYRVLVREQQIRQGVVDPTNQFVEASPSAVKMLRIPTEQVVAHPISGRSCVWIEPESAGSSALEKLGMTFFSTREFLVLEVVGAALQVVEEIFGLDETKRLLDRLQTGHQALFEEVFDKGVVSYPEFSDVLRRLVRERVKIRDLKLILEGVVEFHSMTGQGEDRQQWLTELHGFLRIILSRSIVSDALHPGGKLRTFLLSADVEDEFRAATAMWDGGRVQPPIDPEVETSLRASAEKMFQPVYDRGALPIVVLCSGDIRPAVQEYFGSRVLNPNSFRTLAFEELGGQVSPESVGVLSA